MRFFGALKMAASYLLFAIAIASILQSVTNRNFLCSQDSFPGSFC